MQSNQQLLAETYQETVETEIHNLAKIKDQQPEMPRIGSLEQVNVVKAYYAMFQEQDFDKARQYFYKAALSGEYMIKRYNWRFNGAINLIGYAVLSDDSGLIKRYSLLPDHYANEHLLAYAYNKAIQDVLTGKRQDLEKQIEVIKAQTAFAAYHGCADVFEGLLRDDQPKVEAGLLKLIRTHDGRKFSDLQSRYFSTEAAVLTKLAYRIGMYVQIDSPLVPQAILPLRELPEYDGYEFFKEL
ncbi:hypothetical protein GFS24_10585 [Chitinophaga sp. SYP-B3965]|uniref:Imm49 family immunity protein n=1 Tax=Chitinophaga sp. SYP-B3965 TaxID=2663120 RepID=UPI00129A0678|nr:Imm49 family immunity protein [Chitinophaga sp. SYP-B3965]MRG45564.1 hypothetical protein [Chitinophaga sp. SYP-B3965]